MNARDIGGYLFAHMTKDDYGRLYYSVSSDGLHWEMLNGGERILGEEYLGHPDICRGHDGRHYMIGVRRGDPPVGLWVSGDLVTWSWLRELDPVMFDAPPHIARRPYLGAPKMFYDDATRQYIITWHAASKRRSSEEPERYWSSMRTFFVTSPDLDGLSEPQRLFPYDMATIDVIVRRVEGKYYAVLKDERYPSFEWPTGKSIRIASSDDPLGPYDSPSPPIAPNFREAPTLIPRLDGEGWYLYYEQYPGVSYGASTAPRLDGPWYAVYCMEYSVPPQARHGCMIPLTQSQYEGITAEYGQPRPP